jgi:hypothetical protein
LDPKADVTPVDFSISRIADPALGAEVVFECDVGLEQRAMIDASWCPETAVFAA